MYMKPFCSAEWWTLIFQWSKFHFQIFLLPKPKVSIYSVLEYWCLPLWKVWWSKPTIDENRRPQIWTCFWLKFWARRRNNISLGNCDFCCKQNAIFSGTRHQNRSYLDNISTNRWNVVGFQQGHCTDCSRKVTDENIKISLPILQVLTPNFHSNALSALCKGWLQWIASMMQGLLTLQNHRCKNRPSHDSHFSRISDFSRILFFFKSPKFIQYFRRLEFDQVIL